MLQVTDIVVNVFTTALHHMFYILRSFQICIFSSKLSSFTSYLAPRRLPSLLLALGDSGVWRLHSLHFPISLCLVEVAALCHTYIRSCSHYVCIGACLSQCVLATRQHVGEILITLRICILRLLERRRVKSKCVACGVASCLHLNLLKTQ